MDLMSGMQNSYKDEDGATAIEYRLIAALIAVVIVGALSIVGGNLNNVFGYIGFILGWASDQPV